MKFYDIDSIFTFGKYEGETLAEVFEKDPKYIKYCQENIDDFYIAPDVLKELRSSSRDNKLLTANLDEMSDEELRDFMNQMNDIDEFDESKLEEDFDWEEGENMFAIRVIQTGNVRIFYVYGLNNVIYGIHGYVKKTEQIPDSELKQARMVLKRLIQGGYIK